MTHGITRRAALGAGLALPALATAGAQEAWPARPVRIIVPYAAGGGTDITTRAIAEGLATRFGRNFVVENRPGANGIVGTEAVTRSPPDGYVLGAQTSTHVMAKYLGPLPFDPLNDVTPIALTARYPLVLMASARAPFTDVAGLLEAARARPGVVAQASSDAQSSITARLFAARAGVEIIEVPYRGSGAYIADLTAGHLPVAWGSPATAAPLVAAGHIRIIAVSSPERSPFLPDVPTLRESGVQGADFIGWFCWLAPRGLPMEIANRLNTSINELLAEPAMRERWRTLGMETVPLTVPQFAQLLRDDDAKWAQAAREGLLRPST